MNPANPAVPTSSHAPRAAVVGPKINKKSLLGPKALPRSVPLEQQGSERYPVPGTSVLVQVRKSSSLNTRRWPSLIREENLFRFPQG